MAGITTPFTTPVFPFLQTVSQRTLDNITPAFTLASGPQRRADSADAGRRPRPGRLLPSIATWARATCSSGTRRCSASSRSNIVVEVAYVGSKITRVGLPDTNLNQLTRRSARAGRVAAAARAESVLRHRSRARRRSAIRRFPCAQLLKPYPQYTTVSLYRNNVGTTHLSRRLREARTAVLARPVVSRELHALEADGRCLVGVRRVDSDRAGRQLPGGRQLQSPARARLLDRRHSARVRRVGGVGHSRSARTGAVSADRRARRARQRLDADRRAHAAVGHAASPSRRRPTTTRSPGSARSVRTSSAIRRSPRDERSVSRWFNTSAFAAAPQFTLGTSSRNPVRGPGYRNLDLALIRRVPLPAGTALECRAEVFNVTNTPPLGAPNGVFGSAGLRDDHVGRRSARRAAGGEVPVLGEWRRWRNGGMGE